MDDVLEKELKKLIRGKTGRFYSLFRNLLNTCELNDIENISNYIYIHRQSLGAIYLKELETKSYNDVSALEQDLKFHVTKCKKESILKKEFGVHYELLEPSSVPVLMKMLDMDNGEYCLKIITAKLSSELFRKRLNSIVREWGHYLSSDLLEHLDELDAKYSIHNGYAIIELNDLSVATSICSPSYCFMYDFPQWNFFSSFPNKLYAAIEINHKEHMFVICAYIDEFLPAYQAKRYIIQDELGINRELPSNLNSEKLFKFMTKTEMKEHIYLRNCDEEMFLCDLIRFGFRKDFLKELFDRPNVDFSVQLVKTIVKSRFDFDTIMKHPSFSFKQEMIYPISKLHRIKIIKDNLDKFKIDENLLSHASYPFHKSLRKLVLKNYVPSSIEAIDKLCESIQESHEESYLLNTFGVSPITKSDSECIIKQMRNKMTSNLKKSKSDRFLKSVSLSEINVI